MEVGARWEKGGRGDQGPDDATEGAPEGKAPITGFGYQGRLRLTSRGGPAALRPPGALPALGPQQLPTILGLSLAEPWPG